MYKTRLLDSLYASTVRITGYIAVAVLILQSGSAIGGLIEDRTDLEEILGTSLIMEDFELVELNFPSPPLTPDLWIGPVLDASAGVVDGIIFTREPSGSLTVQDPLLLGGNQVLITNSGAIAIDFISPTHAFGFDFVRPTNTQTEVTLNVYAEDDVTLLATEVITLYFNGFIGYSEMGGIGKVTVSSFSVSLPYVTETRLDNVTFGIGDNGIIEIDIKPNDEANKINPRSSGLLAVAILTAGEFDALQIDPMTVQFGPAGGADAHGRAHVKDVDYDGDMDLLFHFPIQETGIQCGDTEAGLTGLTWDGTAISGTDYINTVGCR
jgi:hypothetical protein